MNDAQIDKLATLARLQLSDKEKKRVRNEIEVLLKHFSQLSSIDTQEVLPTYHFSPKLNLREDKETEGLSREALSEMASDYLENQFRLPRILGGEG